MFGRQYSSVISYRPLLCHYQNGLPMGAGIVSKIGYISLNCLELTGKVKKYHILLQISLGTICSSIPSNLKDYNWQYGWKIRGAQSNHGGIC